MKMLILQIIFELVDNCVHFEMRASGKGQMRVCFTISTMHQCMRKNISKYVQKIQKYAQKYINICTKPTEQ